jgi:hypothetical protein
LKDRPNEKEKERSYAFINGQMMLTEFKQSWKDIL